jgi:hypothetical protein
MKSKFQNSNLTFQVSAKYIHLKASIMKVKEQV